MKKITCLIVFSIGLALLALVPGHLQAQNVSTLPLGDKYKHYYDSLKNMEYDRVFPILGKKAYKAGFDVPFPLGVMVNSFYGTQNIDISNIHVGFRGPDGTLGPVDLSNVIHFQSVSAKGLNMNARADMWVFPFLNVYALLGVLPNAETKVVLDKPVSITSNPSQSGMTYGFGIMGAGGVGPVWIQADFNFTWANMQLLENKVFTRISGVRVGHTFRLKDPQKNISFWMGAMAIILNNETKGEIALADVFPDIDQSKIDEIKASYENWYDDLGPAQKQVMDKIVEKLQDKVNGLHLKDDYITYEMDKKPSSRWAGLAGAQYQFSKRWQLRVESNFISGGDRYSVLASINYRFFGAKTKKANHASQP